MMTENRCGDLLATAELVNHRVGCCRNDISGYLEMNSSQRKASSSYEAYDAFIPHAIDLLEVGKYARRSTRARLHNRINLYVDTYAAKLPRASL